MAVDRSDAEHMRGFDEAAARQFDWVAHSNRMHRREDIDRWRVQVFRQKGGTDDLALAPGISLSDFLRDLRQSSASEQLEANAASIRDLGVDLGPEVSKNRSGLAFWR